jgi:hypothetical protein
MKTIKIRREFGPTSKIILTKLSNVTIIIGEN